jgi:hypothetical protein
LAIHFFVEGRKEINNVVDSKQNCISLTDSTTGVHLKTDDGCTSPYNWVNDNNNNDDDDDNNNFNNNKNNNLIHL